MKARYAALPALVAAVLSAPASAAGAEIAVDRSCYFENTDTITISGSGYTPSSTASVTLGGTTAGVDTDATGAFTTTLAAPSTTLKHHGAQQLTLTGTDDTSGAAATTPVNVVYPGVDGVPTRSKPHKRITWNIAGFPGGKPVYGHWRFGGKTRADRRMGTPTGPCGVLRAKARQIEAGRVRFGAWTVQFDLNKHYDKQTRPAAVLTITVFQTFS